MKKMHITTRLVVVLVGLLSTIASAAPVANGLVLWLDAADTGTITLDVNNCIATWADKATGNGAQNGSSVLWYSPAYVPDAWGVGKPVLRFSAAGEHKVTIATLGAIGIADANAAFAIFYVFQASAGAYFSNYSGSDGGWHHIGMEAGRSYNVRAGGDQTYDTIPGISTAQILTQQYDSPAIEAYRNGTLIGSATVPLGDPATFDNGIALSLGQWGDAAAFSSGDIAEVLIYDRKLTEKEFNIVGDYLQDKWGIEGAFFVPEPTTLVLLGLGGIVALLRRKKS